MYIMCVCLFSALNRRVGALQISIIIKTVLHDSVSTGCSADAAFPREVENLRTPKETKWR